MILVTGGCGFIGSHVVDALVELGAETRVLDTLLPLAHRDRPEYVNPAAESVEADLRDAEAVGRCVAGVDAVAPPRPLTAGSPRLPRATSRL